jgi:hypothetical protein
VGENFAKCVVEMVHFYIYFTGVSKTRNGIVPESGIRWNQMSKRRNRNKSAGMIRSGKNA